MSKHRISKQRDTSILVCVLFLYGLNRFVFRKVVDIAIISYLLKCHFNDWLGGIFIIAYINNLLQHSKYKRYKINTLPCAILINILCGIVWEFVGPYIFHHGVSDLYDIVAYILGGITYIMIQRFVLKLPS